MDVEYALLADSAQVVQGKLYMLGGGIDQIGAYNFPAVHPFLTLAMAIKVYPAECGREHKLEIEVWDQDGTRIGPHLEAKFSTDRRKDDPMKHSLVQLVLNFAQPKFDRPGDYAFQILLNGEMRKTLPLTLVRLTVGQNQVGEQGETPNRSE